MIHFQHIALFNILVFFLTYSALPITTSGEHVNSGSNRLHFTSNQPASYEYVFVNNMTTSLTFIVLETKEEFQLQPSEQRKLTFSQSHLTLDYKAKDSTTPDVTPGTYVFWKGYVDPDRLVAEFQITRWSSYTSDRKKSYTVYLSNEDLQDARVIISGKRIQVRPNREYTFEISGYIPPILYKDYTDCCLKYFGLEDGDHVVYARDLKDKYDRYNWLVD